MSRLALVLLLASCKPEPDPVEVVVEDVPLAPALVLTDPGSVLTDLAQQAVDAAPAWLRDDLGVNLSLLDEDVQDDLGALIVDLDEPWLTDEVAFQVAHLSPEVLDSRWFYPELLVETAQWIYEREADLHYVELVDVGEPGVDDDYYTTTTYRVSDPDGDVTERTIDKEIYYWYIVHPRMEDEHPYYIDGWEDCGTSECPTTPEAGMHWREFLWERAQEDCPSDRECPVLVDYMTDSDVDVLWKGNAYSTDNGAIGAIIRWEQDAIVFGAGDERPIQPNRIYAVGCGNCGEWADMATAAARTSLIPSHNVGAFANDHTWNEFWDDGWQQWEPVNTYVLHWTYYADADKHYYRRTDGLDNDCDGTTDFGYEDFDLDGDGYAVMDGDCSDDLAEVNPGADEVPQNLLDDDCDGTADDGLDTGDWDGDGVSIANGDCDDSSASVYPGATDIPTSRNVLFSIRSTRGDTLVSSERTEGYGTEAYLHFSVTDRRGNPVDGAVVTAYGNWYVYGYPEYGAEAVEGVTDTDGTVTLHVGEANPYGFAVTSPVGNDPDQEGYYYGTVVPWAYAGETYDIDSRVSGLNDRGADIATIEADGAVQATLRFDLSLASGRIVADGSLDGSSVSTTQNVAVDRFIVDDDNLALFEQGEVFDALAVQLDDSGSAGTADLPLDRDWHLVIANRRYASTIVLGTLTVGVEPAGDSTWASPEDLEAPVRIGPDQHVVVTLTPP